MGTWTRLTCCIQSRLQSWGVMAVTSWAHTSSPSAQRLYKTRAALHMLLQPAWHCPTVSTRPRIWLSLSLTHTQTGPNGWKKSPLSAKQAGCQRRCVRVSDRTLGGGTETMRGVVSSGYGWSNMFKQTKVVRFGSRNSCNLWSIVREKHDHTKHKNTQAWRR